jgi:cellulose synthase operon protein C
MRYTSLFALLFAFGTQCRAEETDTAVRVKPTGSRIIELNQMPVNVVREEQPADKVLRNEEQPSRSTAKAARDNVVSSKAANGNIVRFDESLSMHPRSPLDEQETASVPSAPPAPTASAPQAPDERALWRMLSNRRYAALVDTLAQLRTDFPNWQAPPALVLAAREGMLGQRIEQTIAAGDAVGLIALARAHPTAFSCRNAAFSWALAGAHAKLNQHAEAEDATRAMLDCRSEDERRATLYKAREWMSDERWRHMLALEEGRPRSPQGEQQFRQLRYDYRLEQLLSASDRKDYGEAQRLFAALASDIDARKDASSAMLGAWSHYQLAQYDQAASWFERVLHWNVAQHDARRGLALSLLRQQHYDAALAQVQALPPHEAGRNELAGDILVAQAQAAYSAGRFAQTLTLLGSAQTALPRHAQLLAAWSNMELGRLDTAATEFTRLYRESADKESAQGVFYSLTRAGREDDLQQLASTEPLSGLVKHNNADRAYAEKRFLAARLLAPERYAELGTAAAPQLSMLAATRRKSGRDGLSRMELQWNPALEAALPAMAAGELRLRIDRIKLDSGTLPDNAPVGRTPLAATPYVLQPTTQVAGWQPTLAWRDESRHTWEAELGLTPSGGAVASGWTGRLAHRHQAGQATWDVGIHRQPVRESILSYTGLRDPYEGARWGRVLRNGAQAGVQVLLGPRWSANLQAGVEGLNGEQVADNWRVATTAGIAYDLKLAGFDYAVLGVALSFDRFDKNLSQFTFGHGGYFSPQRYWRVGPSVDFMTEENRNWMIKGRISAGRTGNREDTAPLFPLNPDGRMYAAASGGGGAYDIELAAVRSLNSYLQFGALATSRHSPQYNDYAAMGFVRVLFEPRKSVLSSDLRSAASRDLF